MCLLYYRSSETINEYEYDFILNPVVPEIFYFKHDVGADQIIIFIGNPDVLTFNAVA